MSFLRPSSSRTLNTLLPRRSLHTSSIRQNQKVPVNLIAELRKTRPVPISLAREALFQSNNDIPAALSYLESNTSAGEKKANKLAGRSTSEGAIAVSLLGGKRVSMTHLACETDFVARNDVFLNVARGIAGTAAFLDVPSENENGHDRDRHEIRLGEDPIQTWSSGSLLSAPLISLSESAGSVGNDPTTIQQTLLSALSATGENLKLLRTVSFAAPFPSSPEIRYYPGAYAHGGTNGTIGKVGSIVIISVTSSDSNTPIGSMIHVGDLESSLLKLARDLARQVVGFPTKAIERKSGSRTGNGGGSGGELLGTGSGSGEILVEQEFMMIGDERLVGRYLRDWGEEKGVRVRVVGMRRWSVGDVLEDGEKATVVEGSETVDGA